MKCSEHPKFTGKSDPSRRAKPEGRTCKKCWRIYYETQKIPYDEKSMRSVARVHTRYFQLAGHQVQGITSIIGNHDGDKGGLIHAAWKLGLEGINYREEWGQKAKTGTIAHEMIRADLLGLEVDFRRFYPGGLVDRAMAGYEGFCEWRDDLVRFEPILIEHPLVSEHWPYGATLDLLAEVNEYLTLVDFKTGKNIYGSAIVQLAGIFYGLLVEHGYKPERAMILHLKVQDNEGVPEFHVCKYGPQTLKPAWEWFQGICRVNHLYNRVFKGWGK